MTTDATDERDGDAVDRPDRYAELNIADEEYVVYDRQNHRAWLQSTVAVAVDELR